MDMKKIIQETVEENENIFQKIVYFAEQKSWIFISGELNARLKKEYKHYPYACSRPEGNIFQIKKESEEWEMHVDTDSHWNEVTLLGKANRKYGEGFLCGVGDPEIIVFLSEAE